MKWFSDNYEDVPFNVLKGKTLLSVDVDREFSVVIFMTDKERSYTQMHTPEEEEEVSLFDVEGDLDNIVGSPILSTSHLIASKAEIEGNPAAKNLVTAAESYTYNLCTIETAKGSVKFVWYGCHGEDELRECPHFYRQYKSETMKA